MVNVFLFRFRLHGREEAVVIRPHEKAGLGPHGATGEGAEAPRLHKLNDGTTHLLPLRYKSRSRKNLF